MNPSYNIADVVPHSKTMSLLDELVEYDSHSLTAQVTITTESCFTTTAGVPSWIGIEYMAQAIAAYGGTTNLSKGRDINIGFLVGTRKYTCNQAHFPLGETLTIQVTKELEGDNGLNTFSCTIIGESIDAKANINVFQPDDVDAFLGTEET